MEQERVSKLFIKLKYADKRSADSYETSNDNVHKRRKVTAVGPAYGEAPVERLTSPVAEDELCDDLPPDLIEEITSDAEKTDSESGK